MAEIVLYMSPGACSRVTLSALEEAGVAYTDRVINLAGNVQHEPEYLAVNRKGKVPALSVDGKVLTENPAILGYIARLHPEAALLPSASDPFEEMGGLSDLMWCSSNLHPTVRQIRAPHRYTDGETAEVKADGMKKFAKDCTFISRRVAGGRWWYGDDWSIVDVYLYWAYNTAQKGGFPLSDYPELVAHAERVRARPSFQRGLARERAAVEREHLSMDPATL